jgi:hypothetical protein
MGVDRRRAGFRLPWSPDGEQSEEAAATVTDGADDPTRADGEPQTEMTGTDAATSVEATAAVESAAMPATPSPAPSAEGESDEFLKSLVGAMRSVAETSRDTSLADLRTAIEARIEGLGTEAAQGETDIRRKADTDLEAVGEWERAEIDRVRAEAEGKRAARRTKLDEDLAEHRAASERAVEATRSRLAQHENELAAFFSQLGEITDPAAFVAAAKRMPRAPELEGAAPATAVAATPAKAETTVPGLGPTAETAADPRLAALGASGEGETEATDSADRTARDDEVPADESADSAAPSATAESNGTATTQDAQLAERLAQLDERLADAPATATATAPTAAATPGGEGSTAIVVKGLGSFGAITSFKQSLERVEGVRGVTLSLGPTGEFVYRASHAADFDIRAAITSIEGPTATIEDTDGTLVVTLSRGR